MKRFGLFLGLLLLVTAACDGVTRNKKSTENDSDGAGAPPDTTLLFEIESSAIENHVFPHDTYLDRVTVADPNVGIPLLLTPSIRGALGIMESQRIGGFNAAQAGVVNLSTGQVVAGGASHLNQLGLYTRAAYSRTTTIRIPFSQGAQQTPDLEAALANNAIQIFDLGNPVYNTANPSLPPALVDSTGTPVMSATSVPIGSVRYNPTSNSFIIRPTVPFRRGDLAADPLRRRTFAVVVLAAGMRSTSGGNIVPSSQYQAIIDNDTASISDPTQRAAVDRTIADNAQGRTIVFGQLGITRAETLAYFQFTVQDDTSHVSLLRAFMNGQVAVDRGPAGRGDETIAVNNADPLDIAFAPTNGFDGTNGNADDPQVITGQGNIATFFNSVFGPVSLTSATIVSVTDLQNASTTTVTLPARSLVDGIMAGGTITFNPGTASAVSFNVFDNGDDNLTVQGDVASAVGGAQAVPFTVVPPTGGGVAVPQAGIGTIVLGQIRTPNTLTPKTPAAMGGNPFASAVQVGEMTLANPLAFGQPLNNTNNKLVQFGSKILNYILVVPASTQPGGGYPVCIGVHGVTRQKEDLLAIASSFAQAGIALFLIDNFQHGSRQNDPLEGDNSTNVDENGFPDPFINPTLVRRTVAKEAQFLCDLFSSTRAIANANPDPTGNNMFDSSSITYFGQSLGGIIGTVFCATEPLVNRTVLNVPGGSLPDILINSPSVAPSLDGLLLATSDIAGTALFTVSAGDARPFVRNSGRYDVFYNTVENLAGQVDPALYAVHLRATGSESLRGGTPPAVLMQFVKDDTVVPNSTNIRLAQAVFGGDPSNGFSLVNVTTSSFPNPLNPTETLMQSFPIQFNIPTLPTVNASTTGPFVGSGVTQFNAGHGFVLSPDSSAQADLNNTAAAQTQAVTFNAAGLIR